MTYVGYYDKELSARSHSLVKDVKYNINHRTLALIDSYNRRFWES